MRCCEVCRAVQSTRTHDINALLHQRVQPAQASHAIPHPTKQNTCAIIGTCHDARHFVTTLLYMICNSSKHLFQHTSPAYKPGTTVKQREQQATTCQLPSARSAKCVAVYLHLSIILPSQGWRALQQRNRQWACQRIQHTTCALCCASVQEAGNHTRRQAPQAATAHGRHSHAHHTQAQHRQASDSAQNMEHHRSA